MGLKFHLWALFLLLLSPTVCIQAEKLVLDDVPGYAPYHGCAPTSGMEIMGYWDSQGYSDLIPGSSDWNTNQQVIKDSIASPGHIADYALYLGVDDAGWALPFPDMSSVNLLGAHTNNCLADFMGTSRSALLMPHGKTPFFCIGSGMQSYALWRNPSYVFETSCSGPSWEDFIHEINCGRPVTLIVDTDGDGLTDHSATAIGYDTNGGTLTYYTTGAGDPPQPHTWAGVGIGQYWGVSQMDTFRPVSDPYEPDNTSSQANWIYSSSPQTHSISPADDVDWFKFTLSTESQVIIETSGTSGDSRMWLKDSGLFHIEYDDNDGIDLFSHIDRMCGADALPAGTYYVKIDSKDNNHEIPSYTITLSITPCGSGNHNPQLSNGSVNPGSGYASTDFYWYVNYYDEDGDPPSTKKVYIDSTDYAMSLYSGSASNGTYRYGPKNLSVGSHNYYFYFSDGNGGSDRLPPGSGTYPGPSVSSPGAVYFPDPNLKIAIEEELGISNPTQTDMLALEVLVAHNRGITDLTGLEYAINLIELYLSLNFNISDISPLSGLTKLRFLYLYSNLISDISALSGMTNLRELRLHANQISDISALSGLTNLKYLYLHDNNISDISSLSGLTTLFRLDLHYNPLNIEAYCTYLPMILINNPNINLTYDPNPDPSAECPVSILDYNLKNAVEEELGISDPTPTDMLALTSLDSSHRTVVDLTGLEHATNLTLLYLNGNRISNISALSGLTNLTDLGLNGNQISDISALSEMANLQQLFLSQNQISDISALSGLTNLTYLELGGNPLNIAAYCTYLPLIIDNNPGLTHLFYDSNPIDFPDFATFALYWLQANCGVCGGVDLTGDENVDFYDLKKLAENWLAGI